MSGYVCYSGSSNNESNRIKNSASAAVCLWEKPMICMEQMLTAAKIRTTAGIVLNTAISPFRVQWKK